MSSVTQERHGPVAFLTLMAQALEKVDADKAARLIAQAGRSHAAQLLLTGQEVSAARVREIGLIHEVVPSDRLIDEALGRAQPVTESSHVR